VIGAEGDASHVEELQQEVERVGVVNERIDIKAGWRFSSRQILSRFGFVIDRDQVRPDVKSMLDSADGPGKSAATMREHNAKHWEALKDSAEHHRTNRERTFGRHANEPWQPIFRHSLLAHHVPGMNKNWSVQALGRFPEDVERRMIQISAIWAMTMIVWIDMRADLNAMQAELVHATVQFLRGKVYILQRNCPKTDKALRIRANDFGDVVV